MNTTWEQQYFANLMSFKKLAIINLMLLIILLMYISPSYASIYCPAQVYCERLEYYPTHCYSSNEDWRSVNGRGLIMPGFYTLFRVEEGGFCNYTDKKTKSSLLRLKYKWHINAKSNIGFWTTKNIMYCGHLSLRNPISRKGCPFKERYAK